MGGLLGRASQISEHLRDVSSFRVLGTNEPASAGSKGPDKRTRRSMRVPLSRCTFLLAEVISDPCVSAALRLRPFMPKTPWLWKVSCPAEFSPFPAEG